MVIVTRVSHTTAKTVAGTGVIVVPTLASRQSISFVASLRHMLVMTGPASLL